MKIPWPRIVAHYQDLATCEPAFAGLLELSRHVADGPLAGELYAWTSSTDLCIARLSPTSSPSHSETYLRVSHNADGSLDVRHADTQSGTTRWQRSVPKNQVIPGFLLCLEQMRWSTGEATHAL